MRLPPQQFLSTLLQTKTGVLIIGATTKIEVINSFLLFNLPEKNFSCSAFADTLKLP